MRLLLACLRRRKPVQVETEPFLEFVGMAQLSGIVAVQRDDQRALVAIINRDAGNAFKLAGKIGPQTLAFERQRQQRLFARLGLDRSGEHARSGPGGAVPRLAAVVNRDLAAGLSQPPGDAKTDDPGADDDGLRTVRWNNERRANDGLPSPGMPGQVQWV